MVLSLSEIYFPSTSVSAFRDIVKHFNDELFWTFVARTLTWVGLRSNPQVVNSWLVVFVFKSLIMWPNLPANLVDYCSSSNLILSSSKSFSCSSNSWFFFNFSFSNSLLFYYSLFFSSNSLFSFFWRSCSSLILWSSRTLAVLGSIISMVFKGLFSSVKA